MKFDSTQKAGLYCRLSRDDNNGNSESMSIGNQKQQLAEYAEERGWEIAEVYVDDGYTGTTFDRPAFKQMLLDIEARKIDCVITKDLSRLGRNYSRVGYYTEEYFLEWGVRFIAVNDNVDTMKDDNDIAPFKNILNEMYAKDISRKIKSARRVSARQGKFMGSKPPFGYKRSPEDKHLLIIDEKPAEIVCRIFEEYATGESARNIAVKLNRDEISSPRAYFYEQAGKINPLNESATWNANTILQLLQNPVYIGNMVQGKRKVKSFKTKLRAVVPAEDWIIVENTHEPIVSREIFNKAQTRMKKKHITHTTRSGEPSLFTGIVRCADCGAAMAYTVSKSNSGKQSYHLYKCTRYATHGRGICTLHNVSLRTLKTTVLTDLRQLAEGLNTDETAWIAKLKGICDNENQKAIAFLKQRIGESNKRLSEIKILATKLFEERCLGNVPDNLFKKMMSGYDDEQTQLARELIEQKAELSAHESKNTDISSWANEIKKYTNIEKLNRAIVTKLIDAIDVHETVKSAGVRTQEIDIIYKFVGKLCA